jgi:DNA topoisomerase-1
VSAASLTAEGHETKPPARYTEATLIKELEEREIGRPSTYASIIGTIQNRGYVYKKGTALVPAWMAFSVTRLLEEHFPRQVSYEFTAGMEDVLDDIAGGEGPGHRAAGVLLRQRLDVAGLQTLVTELGDIDAKDLATFPIGGKPRTGINLRVGRYGPYVERSRARRGRQPCGQAGQRARRPAARRAHAGQGQGTLRQPRPARSIALGAHPETGLADRGQERPLRSLRHRGAARGRDPRARSRVPGSLFKSMTFDTVTLGPRASSCLSLPRVVGSDAEGVEITAQNGRYGPYLKKGTDSRSLTSEDQSSDITLDEALAIYAQPKHPRSCCAAAPLKELGNDPVSGQPVVVKAGRFGEYVTDGEYNATLRKDDSVEDDHDSSGPPNCSPSVAPRARRRRLPRRPRRRRPAKKPTAKKTAAKKTTAKKTTKKAAAKKS